MSNIAILGSGRVGTALATKLASVGHNITIGSRNTSESSAKWTGPAVDFKNHADAVRDAEIVINATPGDTALEGMTALREVLGGKILIDVTNATERTPNGMPGGLLYPGSSLAERLQQALPATFVVKTLNTMLFMVMANPQILKTPATVFLSGNSQESKARVGELLKDLGWPPPSIEDLGDIATAQGPESFVVLVPHILRNHGFAPFAFSLSR